MLKRIAILAFMLLVASSPVWAQKKGEAKFKSVEVKHFTHGEGVELSAEFPDFLYAELRTALQKSKLFDEVIGEGETVDPASADRSLVVSGNVLEYKKGSVAKTVLIGFGAGRRSMKTHVTVTRLSNKEALIDADLVVKADSRQDQKMLAKSLAKKIADEIKKGLVAKTS